MGCNPVEIARSTFWLIQLFGSPKLCLLSEWPRITNSTLHATAEQIEKAHGIVKNYVCESLGDIGKDIPVLYGGSVNPENAGELIKAKSVDGFLVGGASLESESFSEIIKEVETFIKE